MSPNSQLVAEDVSDHARLVYEVRDALRPVGQEAPFNVVERYDTPVGIGDQGKRQAVLFLKTTVAPHRVEADPHNDGLLRDNGFIVVTEATGLSRSAPREVFRIEVKDDVLFATPVGQPEDAAIVQQGGEAGRLLSNL